MPTITEPPQAPPTEPTPAAELRDVEAWRAETETPPIWHRAAAVACRWPLGQQLSRVDYLNAVIAAQHGA